MSAKGCVCGLGCYQKDQNQEMSETEERNGSDENFLNSDTLPRRGDCLFYKRGGCCYIEIIAGAAGVQA